jgi:hypothetical protein
MQRLLKPECGLTRARRRKHQIWKPLSFKVTIG